MKALIIALSIVALGSAYHDDCVKEAFSWANTHKLPDPTATCIMVERYAAYCDVSSQKHIYPLKCYASASGKNGCYLRVND